MTPRRRASIVNPQPDVRRCAIYTRKSTSAGLEQEFNSLDAQREACEAYIQRQPGWALVPERYDDGGFTGANIDRPAFTRLMADIEVGKIDIVVVYKVDRLSRSLLDFAQVMERFGQVGTAFVSITQNFSTADSMGRLTLNLLISFSAFEREMIAERTRDKIAAARRKGIWTGGSIPLGYDVVAKKLVVNELEAVLVREVYQLYLQHRSALAVMRALNDGGRLTKRHKAASGRTREAREWSKEGVLRVLRNPVYAGYMPYGAELHEGEHEAIVDRETFERTQGLLEAVGGPKTNLGRNPDYLLRGLLHCTCCGGAFTPASTRKGSREYRYYRCVTRDKKGGDRCAARPLPAEAIEGFVIERIRAATRDGNLAKDVTERVKARMAASRAGLLVERDRLPIAIGKLSAEGKRLVDALVEVDGPARRLLDERLRDVGTNLAAHEARLATVEGQLAAIDDLEVEAGWVAQTLTNFDSVWDVLSTDNRGRLVRAAVMRVDVDEPAGKITATLADFGAGGVGRGDDEELDGQGAHDGSGWTMEATA